MASIADRRLPEPRKQPRRPWDGRGCADTAAKPLHEKLAPEAGQVGP